MKTYGEGQGPPLSLSKKPRRVCRHWRQIESNPFSAGACTWQKTHLRLQVWNLSPTGGQIMHAAGCQSLSEKPARGFSTVCGEGQGPPLSLSKKPPRVCRLGRQRKSKNFPPGRVPGGKYFSDCKCGICPRGTNYARSRLPKFAGKAGFSHSL